MELKKCFWRIKSEEEDTPDTIMIVTDNARFKTKIKPMSVFYAPLYPLVHKILGYQFKVVDGSEEHKELFSKLEITDKDEVKEKRKRKKKEVQEQ